MVEGNKKERVRRDESSQTRADSRRSTGQGTRQRRCKEKDILSAGRQRVRGNVPIWSPRGYEKRAHLQHEQSARSPLRSSEKAVGLSRWAGRIAKLQVPCPGAKAIHRAGPLGRWMTVEMRHRGRCTILKQRKQVRSSR